ncbi:MAG: CoA transferase [Deltaproteobacteria bacterium]|nr:CoA transferase [Deltaproteobacteria bacterium]MBW1925303.1 CoA transferase [Deltaproteobacteria bacterium]MBW1950720.1 CoA transferase [Deltaproteobacteria bacterium]MBW2008784.1 CoA transferase [Deltaproteobacteria bacterium]MBW2102478.1 CoA transferase [Deltaproteobacteria bacterium]
MQVIQQTGMLAPYRILDLTNEMGLMCGKLLGDLGADVIKIEKPGGDDARRIGPFYRDEVDPEKSLYWFALNTSKRGITLDIETAEGKEIFKKLVKVSDAVVESFAPGHMDEIGLGYDALCKENPDIIVTSITPFGPAGPYKDFKASDITLWALSGLSFICGDPDRPPLRISLPQSFFHAGADAATGTVMALYHRGVSGEGQHVHVSILKAMERVAYTAHTLWDGRAKILRRPGSALKIPPLGTTTPVVWSCRDGYVAFYLFGGNMGAVSNPALTRWMDEEGLATDVMKGMDWRKFDIGRTPQDEIDRHIVQPISRFFRNHTQEELWKEGVRRRVMVYPIYDARGVLENEHLRERRFWVELEHSPLDHSITYPGPFIRTDKKLCRVRCRAPLIGEHNSEIYEKELRISRNELEALSIAGII